MRLLETRNHKCRGGFRTPRNCWWCGEPIIHGDKYVRKSQIMNSELEVLFLHKECDEAFHEGLKFFEPGAIIGTESKQPRGKCSVENLYEC